MKIFLKDSFEH